jgi:hypothetical protein
MTRAPFAGDRFGTFGGELTADAQAWIEGLQASLVTH